MSLINTGTEAAVAAAGLDVATGSRTATTIAYCANGMILRQKETVATTEYRGMTQSAAEALAARASDNTTTTVYYKQIGTSGEWAAAGITTGEAVDYAPSRADEGDSWTCVKTVRTYAAEGVGTGAAAWTTTNPTTLHAGGYATTGVTVSRDYHKTYVWEFGGDAIYATEDVVVTEYRFLTKAAADATVAHYSGNASSLVRFSHYPDATSGTANAWSYNQAGTDRSASARYVDAEHGWTVTVTERTLGAAGTNWRLG